MANLATIVNNILADSGIDDANVAVITGSNQFSGSQTITGSLTVTGQITAQTLNVQQVTSSIVYSSGSNIFGSSLSDTQQFTGSVSVTGSMNVNGTPVSVGTGSAGQVAFWNGTNSQTGDNGLTWDNTNKRLNISNTENTILFRLSHPTAEALFSLTPAGFINLTGTQGGFSSLVSNGNLLFRNPSTIANTNTGGSTGLKIIGTGSTSGFLNLQATSGNGTAATHIKFLGGNNGAVEIARFFSSGNVGIGTGATDAGFRLDVNGTARVQGTATITGSTTAASAIARGANLTSTLVAAANNDVLVGLDIAPTFTNGAFTGVQNNALRVAGNIRLQGNGFGINMPFSNSFISMESGAAKFQKSFLNLSDPQKQAANILFFGDHNDGAVDLNQVLNIEYTKRGVSNVSNNILIQGRWMATSASAGNLGFTRLIDLTVSMSEGSTVSTNITGINLAASKGSTGTITSYKGIYLNDTTVSNTIYGIHSDINSGVNKWGLYFSGTANNYLGGNLLINTTTDSGFRLDVNGTARVSGNTQITGSFTVITGSAVELQVTNLGVNIGSATTDVHNVTGSLRVSGSMDLTGNARVSGSSVFSGSVQITGTSNTSTSSSLVVYGSGSAQPVFTVQGSQGELFSITDSLSGSLFSVNDISGLPILEVFSNGDTLIGDYTAPAVYTTRRVASTTAGVNVIYSLATSSYDGVFVDYTIRSGSVGRAGNFMAMWSGSSADFTDNSINGFGTTSNFVFGASISGSNLIVSGSGSTAGWTVKTIIRGI